MAVPEHQHGGRNHLGQMVGDALGPEFLYKADHAAGQQHPHNNHRRGDVAAEIGHQHHVGQKGDHRQHKQNHREGIDKSPPQPVENRVGGAPRQNIFSVPGAAFFHLFLTVALLGNMKRPVQRADVRLCVIQHTPMDHGKLFHLSHLSRFGSVLCTVYYHIKSAPILRGKSCFFLTLPAAGTVCVFPSSMAEMQKTGVPFLRETTRRFLLTLLSASRPL